MSSRFRRPSVYTVFFITTFAAEPSNAVEERGVKDVEPRFSFGEAMLQEIISALCDPFEVSKGKRPEPTLLDLGPLLVAGGSGASPISISRAVGPAVGALRRKCCPPSAEAGGLNTTGADCFGVFGGLGATAKFSTVVLPGSAISAVAAGAATAVRTDGRPPGLEGLGPAGAGGAVGGRTTTSSESIDPLLGATALSGRAPRRRRGAELLFDGEVGGRGER